MPKVARVSKPVPASADSDSSPLVSIALFCGIGLLVSLVAILLGIPSAWH